MAAIIKEMRLQKAYTLLQEGELDVAEVGYQTGFNTPGYFSKTFKDRFGISPSKI